MFVRSTCCFIVLLSATSCLLFGQQRSEAHPQRNAQAIEILDRVLQAAGGAQSLAAVHDITESGEITFYWGENVKGPVTIRTLGGNHFRMEADLPQGKSTWIVKDGVGSRRESEKVIPISRLNAINLGNLTYPVGHAEAALVDPTAETAFVGIEKREGRSVYRLRVTGRLGLVGGSIPGSVSKDLIVDALTFEILSVQDHPYWKDHAGRKAPDTAPREIDFGDFRVVNGVRMPFSISTALQGQRTLSIRLSTVTFNNHPNAEEFQVEK